MKPPLNPRVSSSVPPSLLCPSVCVDRCVIFPIFFKNTSDTTHQVSGHQEWEGNKPGMALHPCPYLDISSSSMCCLLAGWCINNVFFCCFPVNFVMHRWGCRLHTTPLLSLTLQLSAHQDGNWSQPQPVCSIKELLHLKHLQPSVTSSKGRKVDTMAGCYVQGPSVCGRECPTSQRLLGLWSPNCAMGVRRVSFFFVGSALRKFEV